MIVQAETVLRWRRNGWSAIGVSITRSLARWASRVSSEVRPLIAQMARENFLWGAPRIHGELLMLGFIVSQATVSRYMPPPGRRPGRGSPKVAVSVTAGRGADQTRDCGRRPTRCLTRGGTGQRYE